LHRLTAVRPAEQPELPMGDMCVLRTFSRAPDDFALHQARYLRKTGSQELPPAICPGSVLRQTYSGTVKNQVQAKLSHTPFFHV